MSEKAVPGQSATTKAPTAKAMLGRYQVIGTLGSGGMSNVSLARSQNGELVVLKRQHTPAEDTALYDEARVGIRLFHPNIVDHLDLFEHDGRPVLVIEHVSGATLADLKSCGPLPVPMILRIGQQISAALHYLHSATEEDGSPLCLLHRDVTPGNIMIGHDGNARLIDFGIARGELARLEITQEGILKGTLRYLAPELLDADISVYTPATDLWGLGMSLWEAALGRYAIDGDDPLVFASIVSGRALQLEPGEDIDPILRMAVAQLLSKEPSCRPASADHASLVFGQYLPQFDDIDQICREYVSSAVGPAVTLSAATSLHDRRLLVNRAAATFGGPSGDWELVAEPGLEKMAFTLPLEDAPLEDAPLEDPSLGDVPLEDAPTDEFPIETDGQGADEFSEIAVTVEVSVSSATAPAPVDLPSLESKRARSEEREFADVPATESIDMEEVRQARADALAAQFDEGSDIHSPWDPSQVGVALDDET